MLAMRAVWENVFRTLVTWWLDHPDETPEAMTQRCIRLFSAVFGEVAVNELQRPPVLEDSDRHAGA
jgi:hypothetical protein